jgi:hypothetical protein
MNHYLDDMFLLLARLTMHAQQEQDQLSRLELPEKLITDSGNILQKGTIQTHNQQDYKRKILDNNELF